MFSLDNTLLAAITLILVAILGSYVIDFVEQRDAEPGNATSAMDELQQIEDSTCCPGKLED